MESQNRFIINQIKTSIELDCLYKDQTCLMQKEIAQYLLNVPFLYVRSLNKTGDSYIRQIIFIFEIEKCSISFLTMKSSQEEINLQNNPIVSLTTKLGFNSNPEENFGLIIKAKTNLVDSEIEKNKIAICLLRKYSSHLINPGIVDLYSSNYDVIVNAKIEEIFHWNNHKNEKFTCRLSK